MDQPNVEKMIDNLKPLDPDKKPPLQIDDIKRILLTLETSIKELKFAYISPDEHQRMLDQIELINKTLSSEDLTGR